MKNAPLGATNTLWGIPFKEYKDPSNKVPTLYSFTIWFVDTFSWPKRITLNYFGGKEMIKAYSKVKTLVEKEGYPAGSIGVVVSLYSSGAACEVELWDDNNYPVDVVTFTFDEIQEIS